MRISMAFDSKWQSKLHIKMQKTKNKPGGEQNNTTQLTNHTTAVTKTVWYYLKDRQVSKYTIQESRKKLTHIGWFDLW